MKNKKLQKKLNIYADSLKCRDDILNNAYHEMYLKRASGDYNNKNIRLKKRFGLAGFAAAAIVFAVIIGIIINNIQGKSDKINPISSYSLSSLQKQSVSFEDFYNLTDVVFLSGEAGQTDGRFFIYLNDKNEIYAARAIYKVVRDGNVDEIEIISDLKNNLSDYKSNKPTKNNSVIRDFDSYKNGEYYSYLAALKNDTTYYIVIASPSRYAGEYYENILF